MAPVVVIVKDEKVIEIIPLRPGREWMREGVDKACLIESDDPQFANVKVGSVWLNRDNELKRRATDGQPFHSHAVTEVAKSV